MTSICPNEFTPVPSGGAWGGGGPRPHWRRRKRRISICSPRAEPRSSRGTLPCQEADPEIGVHAAAVLARTGFEERVAQGGGALGEKPRGLAGHAALLAAGALDGAGDACHIHPQILLTLDVESAQAGGVQLAPQ